MVNEAGRTGGIAMVIISRPLMIISFTETVLMRLGRVTQNPRNARMPITPINLRESLWSPVLLLGKRMALIKDFPFVVL